MSDGVTFRERLAELHRIWIQDRRHVTVVQTVIGCVPTHAQEDMHGGKWQKVRTAKDRPIEYSRVIRQGKQTICADEPCEGWEYEI